MKQELENRAKQILMNKFVNHKGLIGIDFDKWERQNRSIHDACINAIVQALMEVPNSWNKCDCEIPKPVDPFDDPSTCRDCNGYIQVKSVSAEIAQVQFEEINDGKTVIGWG